MSFIILIGIGTFLLLLPFAHKGELRMIDAFFTSTSAVCVTGLIVKDTHHDFTLFGQIIIMLLIQIGGLGYMTAVTFLTVIRHQKLDHRDRLVLQESLNYPGMKGLVHFLRIVFASIAIIDVGGMVILTLRFWVDMPIGKAIWFGVFHAISAFNNAGFSLFANNMMDYRDDVIINLTIPLLIILGGLGYLVVIELYNFSKKEVVRISTHTKIVLGMSLLLIVFGILLLLSLEWNHAFASMPWYRKIMAAWFASVNYRTAGFNTIDFSTLTDSNLFFGTFFMMTGGAPGGTAGGIKITVVALALLGMWYTLRGDTNAHIFHRSISPYQINKAYTIIFIASIYVVVSTIILSEVEQLPFLRTLFEACSAFGTVGLSTGNGDILSYSALFSDIGKLNIIVLMFMGRIGVFAFTVVIIGKAVQSRIKYAEGRIIL
ncbi:MAG: TrkH family potassium uptake protein [Candidatus Scalindua sp.]|nr:TrkH family potassium uptake protein [Candidatus Scalindua sp.]